MSNQQNTIATYAVKQSCSSDHIAYSEKEAKQVYKTEVERLTNQGYEVLANEITITKEINAFATFVGYSDCEAYEIVRVISDQTLEIRMLNTELLNGKDLEFHVGGFSAHCSNQRSQKYNYTSNPNATIIRIRKKKNSISGEWGSGSLRFVLASQPYKFHDYNF